MSSVLGLDVLLGASAAEVAERLAARPGWEARVDVLDDVLLRSLGCLPPASAELDRAWAVLVSSGGAVQHAELRWPEGAA